MPCVGDDDDDFTWEEFLTFQREVRGCRALGLLVKTEVTRDEIRLLYAAADAIFGWLG